MRNIQYILIFGFLVLLISVTESHACDVHTVKVNVRTLPESIPLFNTTDPSCGGNPDLPPLSNHNISGLPYILPEGSSISELSSISTTFLYSWRTTGAVVCPLPASQLCPDGSTVNRNPSPDCTMPACPSTTWPICIERVKQTIGGNGNCEGIDSSMTFSVVVPSDCSGHSDYDTSSPCPKAVPDQPEGLYHYDYKYYSQECKANGAPAMHAAFCCSGNKIGMTCAP